MQARTFWLVAAGGLLLAAKVAGLYTFGFVASGSMEPTLPQGSLFFAATGPASVGDIVVFPASSGDLVVHRVVEVRQDGFLVTKGDANARDDVASGLGAVDPRDAQVVPQVGGAPLHLDGAWARPAGIVAVQIVVLAIGIRSTLKNRDGKPSRIHAHHVVLAASALLLVSAPLFHDSVEVDGQVGVRSSLIPIVASVTSPLETRIVELGSMDEVAFAAAGAVDVVYAPALPGATWLSQWGATAAVLPAVAVGVAVSLAMRIKGA